MSKEKMDEKCQAQALEAIKEAYGHEDQEYGVTLFVNHHLKELDNEYWKSRTGTNHPSPSQVLDVLVFKSKWVSDGEEIYDYSLPSDVTQYVLSVRFDVSGRVREISMES